MIRKQIYIKPEQESSIKRIAKLTGITEAEIIRRALERHLLDYGSHKKNSEAWKKEVTFIKKRMKKGAWLSKKMETRRSV